MMIDTFDVWTFTDASIKLKDNIGCYGFIHMSKDPHTGTLFEWANGFQTVSDIRETDTLEAAAIYIALLDIRRNLSKHWKFGIVTDSDNVYYPLQAIIDAKHDVTCFDIVKQMNRTRRMILETGSLFRSLINVGYSVSIKLCKSHLESHDMTKWLAKMNDPLASSDYAKNICIGNSLIDYHTNYIAHHGGLPVQEQWSNRNGCFGPSPVMYE